MIKIDCKKYATEILNEVKAIPKKKQLVIITVGNDPASASYVKGKMKDCEYCGIPVRHLTFEETITEQSLYDTIISLNKEADDEGKIGGIIVQLPLPKHIDEDVITNAINYKYDVDGFKANSPFNPCTPEAVIHVMKKELGENLYGKNVLVVGRGKLVGKPLSKMLLDENCSVMVAHSKSNITFLTNDNMYYPWDCVVFATGHKFIHVEDVNAKLIIDCGINRDTDGKLCGDCYGYECYPEDNKTHYTPVPNGIGLLTRAMLIKHIGEASKQ